MTTMPANTVQSASRRIAAFHACDAHARLACQLKHVLKPIKLSTVFKSRSFPVLVPHRGAHEQREHNSRQQELCHVVPPCAVQKLDPLLKNVQDNSGKCPEKAVDEEEEAYGHAPHVTRGLRIEELQACVERRMHNDIVHVYVTRMVQSIPDTMSKTSAMEIRIRGIMTNL